MGRDTRNGCVGVETLPLRRFDSGTLHHPTQPAKCGLFHEPFMGISSAKTPVIIYSQRWGLGECTMCGAEITEESRCASIEWSYVKRGVRNFVIEPVCPNCLRMVAAEQDAKYERRRFTKVSTAQHGTRLADYYGSRCLCGAAALQSNSLCVQCWKEQRMLGKAQADITAIKKMTTQLNRQIKEQINHGNQ